MPAANAEHLAAGVIRLRPESVSLFAADILAPARSLPAVPDSGILVTQTAVPGGSRVQLRAECAIDLTLSDTTLRVERQKDESFYGFGEWFNGFERGPGTELEIYNRESPAFAQHKQTYSAFPFFLSPRGYAILVLNAHRAAVRITEESLSIAFDGGELDVLVCTGRSPKEILERYTLITGRPPLLPRWAFGIWNTAFPVENEEQTLARVEEHRKRGIPLDCVILDYHWEEAFHNFRFRKSLFPDPARFMAELAERGVRTGLIYTPYINKRGVPLFKLAVRLYVPNAPKGTPFFSEDADEAFYREGLAGGFFAHKDFVWWLGRAGAVDFTNPAAVAWWFKRQKELLDMGVQFFKNDGGEYLPDNAVSAMGLRSGEHHNIYSFYYARAVFEETQKHLKNRRALVFSRTAWAGTQRYPGIFLGDQTPEKKHILSTMNASLNMSLQGFAYYGADVFGLFGKLNKDRLILQSRWALFTPIARYFSRPGDETRNPWGAGPAAEDDFKRHALLRMSLLPYYYTLARNAYDTGAPILRPLLFEFPDDPEARRISDQVMIGPSLLLAPHSDRHAREVYLPAGRWYCYFTGKEYLPGRHRIEVGEWVPLFVREGHAIPAGPALETIADSHWFGELTFRVYPGGGAAQVYDDDGVSVNQSGARISLQVKDGRLTSSQTDSKPRKITLHFPAGGTDVSFDLTDKTEMPLP